METRVRRGFEFVTGIDDAATECELDDIERWDIVIGNDGEVAVKDMSEPILMEVERSKGCNWQT
jgi:phosphomevalonate kinase